MNTIKIKDVVQTSEACPSQWDFITEDNRIGYVRYRWGGLSVCLSVPFDMVVDNTTLFDIVKHNFNEWKRRTFTFGGFDRILIHIFPNTIEYIKQLFTDIYRYWLVKNKYTNLNKVSDIPTLFEFVGVGGREVLYTNMGDGFDGFIEWPEVWDELEKVDYLKKLDDYVQRENDIDERQWYIRYIERGRKCSIECLKEAKKYRKRMKNTRKRSIKESGLIQIVSDKEKGKEKDNTNKMALSELMELGKLFNEGIEQRKIENAEKRKLKNK